MTYDDGRPSDLATDAATLPPERAFVVQLRAAAGGDGELFVGRAEHIASGVAARFASLTELIGFVQQVLAARVQTPTGKPAGGSGDD
jgi:hypothetical protein